jgi:hypothetical protein
MRVLTACLAGFLGLAALSTMAACSDSTDMGAAGTGGSSAAGSGGKAGSGGHPAAEAGAAGAGECGFKSIDCSTCFVEKCPDQATACTGDCASGLYALPECVCDPSKDFDTCTGKFVSDNGDPARDVIECFTLNCADACK